MLETIVGSDEYDLVSKERFQYQLLLNFVPNATVCLGLSKEEIEAHPHFVSFYCLNVDCTRCIQGILLIEGLIGLVDHRCSVWGFLMETSHGVLVEVKASGREPPRRIMHTSTLQRKWLIRNEMMCISSRLVRAWSTPKQNGITSRFQVYQLSR